MSRIDEISSELNGVKADLNGALRTIENLETCVATLIFELEMSVPDFHIPARFKP